MRLLSPILSFLLLFALVGAPASASAKEKRSVTTFEGKISDLKNGRDMKKKRYWEYRLKTAAGRTILVHDYEYGRYRQPASQGIKPGAKRKVRGFFVKISTKRGSSKKEPVFIVSSTK